jgi:hypothetical protein
MVIRIVCIERQKPSYLPVSVWRGGGVPERAKPDRSGFKMLACLDQPYFQCGIADWVREQCSANCIIPG